MTDREARGRRDARGRLAGRVDLTRGWDSPETNGSIADDFDPGTDRAADREFVSDTRTP